MTIPNLRYSIYLGGKALCIPILVPFNCSVQNKRTSANSIPSYPHGILALSCPTLFRVYTHSHISHYILAKIELKRVIHSQRARTETKVIQRKVVPSRIGTV